MRLHQQQELHEKVGEKTTESNVAPCRAAPSTTRTRASRGIAALAEQDHIFPSSKRIPHNFCHSQVLSEERIVTSRFQILRSLNSESCSIYTILESREQARGCHISGGSRVARNSVTVERCHFTFFEVCIQFSPTTSKR